ncbi:MAG: class I SAM-dependent methyltransferase [Acidimicrobiales bacterium]
MWKDNLVPPIVEVGAGDGLLALARTFSSMRVVSVDQSTTGLRSAPDPKIVGTLERLPIRSGYANTIIAAEVLEHAGDPLSALTVCRRIAQPEARLLLWEPLKPIPLFGFLASGLMYVGESATNRILGRRLQLAQVGASCDRLWSTSTRHSGLAVVCRRNLSFRP